MGGRGGGGAVRHPRREQSCLTYTQPWQAKTLQRCRSSQVPANANQPPRSKNVARKQQPEVAAAKEVVVAAVRRPAAAVVVVVWCRYCNSADAAFVEHLVASARNALVSF
jgi:hypothetical protein